MLEIGKSKTKKLDPSTSSPTPTLKNHFPDVTKSKTVVTKKRSLVDIISDYVITDLQPISTGEKEGFKRMFKELNPEITKFSPPPGATPCEHFVENIQGLFFYRYESRMVLRAHRSFYRHAIFCKL